MGFVFAAGLGLVAADRYTDGLQSADGASIGFSVLALGCVVFASSHVLFARRMGAKRHTYERFFAGDPPDADVNSARTIYRIEGVG